MLNWKPSSPADCLSHTQSWALVLRHSSFLWYRDMFWPPFVIWAKLWQLESNQKPVRRHTLTCYQSAVGVETKPTVTVLGCTEMRCGQSQNCTSRDRLTQKECALHYHYKINSCKTVSHTLTNHSVSLQLQSLGPVRSLSNFFLLNSCVWAAGRLSQRKTLMLMCYWLKNLEACKTFSAYVLSEQHSLEWM